MRYSLSRRVKGGRTATLGGGAIWRDEIDSLAFRTRGHTGHCVVHRLAFRTLVGAPAPPESCRTFFREHREAFEDAARAKVAAKNLPVDTNFHLTSRDLRRILVEIG